MHLLLLLLVANPGQIVLDSLKLQYEREKNRSYAERVPTIDAIGLMKTDEAADFLTRVFEEDESADVRVRAVGALGVCGTPKARAKVEKIARDPEAGAAYRLRALVAFAETGSEAAFQFVQQCCHLQDWSDPMRMAGFAALEKFPLQKTEQVWRDALRDALEYQDEFVARFAFVNLAPLKDKDILGLARKALEDKNQPSYTKVGAVEPWKAAGGPEAAAVLLAAGGTTDMELRMAIVDALAGMKDEESIGVVFQALSHVDPLIPPLAAEALGGVRRPGVMEHLKKALRKKSEMLRIAALKAIARQRDAESEEILQSEAKKGSREDALTALELLVDYPGESTIRLLLELAEKTNTAVRITAIDALSMIGTPQIVPILKKAIEHKEWPVRAAAIRALGRVREKTSVDLLIARLEKEEGRLRHDIAQALRNLTGNTLGVDHGHWRNWWNVSRETFEFPKEEGPAGIGAGPGGTTFYGIPITSDRIIFCLDISGSMGTALVGTQSRLDEAKAELAKVLNALGKDVDVNLVFFHDQIFPWHTKMVPIKRNIRNAMSALENLKAEGGTNVFDALERAFADKNVDTIYLLSDGYPTSGRHVNPAAILQEISSMNRARQITIHAVSLGANPFLRLLAYLTHGEYMEIK